MTHRDNRLIWVAIFAAWILLCFSKALMAEEFYRWQGKDGVAHYGSTPPQGVTATKIKVYVADAYSKTAPQPSGEQAPTDPASETDPVKQRQLQRAQQKACVEEQGRLDVLQARQPIRMKQQDGSTRYLTTQEIDREIRLSQRYMADACQ